MKAKDASLASKILAGAIALVGSFAKGRGWLPGITEGFVIQLAAFVAVVFVTVDLNLLAEKVFHWSPTLPAAVRPSDTQGVPN